LNIEIKRNSIDFKSKKQKKNEKIHQNDPGSHTNIDSHNIAGTTTRKRKASFRAGKDSK
jgi:hypothetical protein